MISNSTKYNINTTEHPMSAKTRFDIQTIKASQQFCILILPKFSLNFVFRHFSSEQMFFSNYWKDLWQKKHFMNFFQSEFLKSKTKFTLTSQRYMTTIFKIYDNNICINSSYHCYEENINRSHSIMIKLWTTKYEQG